MDEKFLNLPWEIQLALGSGYVAYRLAYLGIRYHHKAIDVTFRTIAFGLCATGVLKLVPENYGWVRPVAAITAAVLAGVLWRLSLADAVQRLIRKLNLSWSDETPSAWSCITQHNRRVFCSQLTVQLDDDRWLFCNDTRPFANAPFGPCIFGPDGDVALYVTHKCDPDGEIVPAETIRDPYHGDEMTYVPASRVRKISMRLLRRSSDSEVVEEELSPEAEAVP